jgi:hypothetical protein
LCTQFVDLMAPKATKIHALIITFDRE